MNNSYTDSRQIFDRRHGPAIGAAGDGQEGTYTGVLHTDIANGQCQVVIPALGLTRWRTADVAPYVTGKKGDTCVVAFDEQKILWVISAQSLALPAPTTVTSFGTNWSSYSAPYGPVRFWKDLWGVVHMDGLLLWSGGTTAPAANSTICTLPGCAPGSGRNYLYPTATDDSATIMGMRIVPSGADALLTYSSGGTFSSGAFYSVMPVHYRTDV